MKPGPISLPEDELHFEYIRAPGPGGQNVNKVATAVQLRFNAAGSPSLAPEVRARLLKLAGNRVTINGEIVINAHQYRSQEKNRQDAISRLTSLIERALTPPKARYATRPTRSSREKRLKLKRKRSEIKSTRKRTLLQDD